MACWPHAGHIARDTHIHFTTVAGLQQQRAHLGRVSEGLGPTAHAVGQEDRRRVGRGGDGGGGARLLAAVSGEKGNTPCPRLGGQGRLVVGLCSVLAAQSVT